MSTPGAFADAQCDRIVMAISRGVPMKTKRAKPITTFERGPALVANLDVDRETSERVQKEDLKTVSEALANYHLWTEDKFENGGPWDCGRTRRRRVQIVETVLIGKEATKVGKGGEIDPVCGEVAIFNTPKREARDG